MHSNDDDRSDVLERLSSGCRNVAGRAGGIVLLKAWLCVELNGDETEDEMMRNLGCLGRNDEIGICCAVRSFPNRASLSVAKWKEQ